MAERNLMPTFQMPQLSFVTQQQSQMPQLSFVTQQQSQMPQLSFVTQQQSPMPQLSLVTQQQSTDSQIGLTNVVQYRNKQHFLSQHPPVGPVPTLVSQEFDKHMAEYVKFIKKQLQGPNLIPIRPRPPPPVATPSLNPLEMSRRALLQLYNNNSGQPKQQLEALNLSKPIHQQSVYKERELDRENQILPRAAKRLLHDEEISPPFAPSTSTHIRGMNTNMKITNKGDAKNENNSIEISIEFNGVMYQGVLFAQQEQNDTPKITT